MKHLKNIRRLCFILFCLNIKDPIPALLTHRYSFPQQCFFNRNRITLSLQVIIFVFSVILCLWQLFIRPMRPEYFRYWSILRNYWTLFMFLAQLSVLFSPGIFNLLPQYFSFAWVSWKFLTNENFLTTSVFYTIYSEHNRASITSLFHKYLLKWMFMLFHVESINLRTVAIILHWNLEK
jgi:hypothetical protein